MTQPQPIPTQLPPYVATLNDPQRQAALALDGPVLVLAGAGTGKTRVLTTRLAHLLRTEKCWPSQILAVTFTNKAAGEMRERVAALLGQPVEGWWLGTFHALSARMLRAHAEKVGLTPSFTILDDSDQERLIKQILEAEGVDLKKTPPRLLLSMIARWKDKGFTPAQVGTGDAGMVADGKAPYLYGLYQNRLKTLNACDFGDLLLHMITIFKDSRYPEVLAEYHRKFRYVMVDEYQDTNTAQYLWLRLLARGSGNICCVGDDDQSIYGWRGAEIANILNFERDFPGAVVVRLEQNYRSTGHILGAASGVIAHNRDRLGKTLWSDGEVGDPVRVEAVWDGEAEARWVSDDIEAAHKKGQALSTMAILVRAGHQMRTFEERFLHIGLPYRVFGGPRFYERAEIRDALAYLRLVVQPMDDLAVERVINVPKRGLGESTLKLLYDAARARGEPLLQAAAHLVLTPGALKPKINQTVRTLLMDIDRWRAALGTTAPDTLAGQILDESGYTAMWQAEKSPDAQTRLENLKELVSTIGDYESLPAFLDHVALVMENVQNADTASVSLMTLHAAKGLEFDTVYLPGWEEGLFPSPRAVDEAGTAGLEEERRLAYVGLTRARRRAVILCAGSRRLFGNFVQNSPSRFIGELPTDHVHIAGAVGTALHLDPGAHPEKNWGSSPRLSAPMIERAGEYRPGTRVTHADFGPGTVLHAAGQKLDIRFDTGETHRILQGFVTTVS